MTELLNGALLVAQVLMHGAAFLTGMAVLRKYEPEMQAVTLKKTFSPHELRNSYMSRGVMILGVTLPFSLISLWQVFAGQIGPSVADLVYGFVTVNLHVYALKDKRNRANA